MRYGWMGGLTLAAMLGVAGSATAGGLFCLLRDRGVQLGTVSSSTGAPEIRAEQGKGSVTVSDEAIVLRIERVRAGDLKPGELVALTHGKSGEKQTIVVVRKAEDLFAAHHVLAGSARPGAVRADAKAAPAVKVGAKR